MDYDKLEKRHPQIIVAESLYGTKRQNIFSTDINPKDVHPPLTSFATIFKLEHKDNVAIPENDKDNDEDNQFSKGLGQDNTGSTPDRELEH